MLNGEKMLITGTLNGGCTVFCEVVVNVLALMSQNQCVAVRCCTCIDMSVELV
jgi:hypothetical protein